MSAIEETTDEIGPDTARTPRTDITREMILAELAAARRPVLQRELGDRLGLTDRLDRKAMSNRLAALEAEGKIRKHSTGPGKHATYALLRRRGRPPGRELELVTSAPSPATVRTISVDDACVGMLLGMVGPTIPTTSIPEVAAWMSHTASLLDRLP